MNRQIVKNAIPLDTLEALQEANKLSERMIELKKIELKIAFAAMNPSRKQTDEFEAKIKDL